MSFLSGSLVFPCPRLVPFLSMLPAQPLWLRRCLFCLTKEHRFRYEKHFQTILFQRPS